MCKQQVLTTSLILLGVAFIILPLKATCDTDPDTIDLVAKHGWVGTDAWSLHRAKNKENLPGESSCSCEPTNCDAEVTQRSNGVPKEVIYYKQFVKRLFNPHRFREIDSDMMSRTVNIRLKKDQLNRLNELLKQDNDLHELAELVTSLILEANDGFVDSMRDEVLSIYEPIHQQFIHLGHNKTIRFILYCITFLLTAFLISRWSRKSFFVAVVLAALILGFILNYHECNRQKEIDQIVAFKKLESSGDPCSKVEPSNLSWFAKLFTTSSENACIEHLRQMGNVELGYCEPMEVAVNYMTKIHFLIVEKIIKSSLSTFKTATESSSFVEQIIIGIIIVCLMVAFGKVVIGSMISSMFKHGFSNILNTSSLPRNETTQQSLPHGKTSGVEEIKLARDIMQTWKQSMDHQTKLLDALSKSGVNINEASDLVEKLKTAYVTTEVVGDGVDAEVTSFEFIETVEVGQGDGLTEQDKKDK